MSVFKQKDYLLDYLHGLEDIKISSSFPIATIIIEEGQRAEVLGVCDDEKITVLEVDENNIEALLKKLFDLLETKSSFALNVKNSIPALLMLFLKGLAEGQIDIVFANGSQKIVDRIGRGFFATLVLTQDVYQQSSLENISSSFCNLTR